MKAGCCWTFWEADIWHVASKLSLAHAHGDWAQRGTRTLVVEGVVGVSVGVLREEEVVDRREERRAEGG